MCIGTQKKDLTNFFFTRKEVFLHVIWHIERRVMMTKQQHIDYWINTAEDDWGSVDLLFNGKKYMQSLFWAHLVLEKLTKAIWVKSHAENTPPKIHNLILLLGQSNEIKKCLLEMLP